MTKIVQIGMHAVSFVPFIMKYYFHAKNYANEINTY